jgi:tetratricopeptide (TPR) repeat protein
MESSELSPSSEPSPFSEPSSVVAPPFVHAHNRLVLLLMIKNESRIIERCLSHAVPYVDAVAILDTGSTDNTVALAEAFLAKTQKPFLLESEPFKNFGHSRTTSFQVAQRLAESLSWDPQLTYALAVDADMVIRPQPAFFQYPLHTNGYNMIQENGSMKYYNTRLMKCGHPWKCVGATHEYWSGDPTEKIPYEIFHIDDKNDGGCKSDKFERDVRLLQEDLEADPKNGRTHFYLGQSLKDLGRFDEAIEMFKKRIELGGWAEEVWYSHLQIGRCYDHKGDEHMMEYWMNKAHAFRPTRAEPVYHLTKYFREKSQHHKAYHYYLKGRQIPYPKDDVLFIQTDIYNGLFFYEKTILDCYVKTSPHDKVESMVEIMTYLNKYDHYRANTHDNTIFYASPLIGPVYEGNYEPLLFPPHGPKENPDEYQPSSSSMVPIPNSEGQDARFYMNTRFVNYWIDSRGCYHMRSPDGHVKTKNGLVLLNKDYRPLAFPKMVEEIYDRHPSNIEGLEDVRLFYHDGELRCIASSKDSNQLGRVVICHGRYDLSQGKIHHVRIVEPPTPSECEKNHLPVPNEYLAHLPAAQGCMNFVYQWFPLKIGALHPEEADTYHDKLVIHTVHQTPRSWEKYRGSSPLVEYNNRIYGLIHTVRYSTPRVYLHGLVEFTKQMKPVRYSTLFTLRRTQIEYSIGLHIQNDIVTMCFSENDASPGLVHVPFNKFKWMEI